MKKSIVTRVLSLTLAFVLCFAALPVSRAMAADTTADPDNRYAAVAKNVGASTIDSLLNQQTLHPQKTGYAALDNLLESVVGPVRDKSVAEQVKHCYEWTIRNIDYSWAGYTAQNSGYNGFNLKKNAYPYNDYQAGLQKAFPDEIIARTYYTMANHKGVCYDYAAVFAVLVRYVGLDAYVHTGQYTFETALGFSGKSRGHHGWTEISLSGKNYIFDPQREYRFTNNGKTAIDYSRERFFGVASGNKYYSHYSQESANKTRDAGFLSVTAHREELVSVNATASRSGSVSGAGTYDIGTEAVLTATPNEGKGFIGWYGTNGNLLSQDTTYRFTVSAATTVYAMFEGDLFYDVADGVWYQSFALRAGQEGWITGTAPYRFSGDMGMSRAMIVQILSKIEGADLSQYTGATKFADVPTDQWYSAAVAWAYDKGVAAGVSATSFDPNRTITREELFVMINGYLKYKGITPTAADLPYSDASTTDSWAVEAARNLQGAGLIAGYNNGKLGPKDSLTRAMGATVLVGAADYVKNAAQNTPTEPTVDPSTEPTEPTEPTESTTPTETPDTSAQETPTTGDAA